MTKLVISTCSRDWGGGGEGGWGEGEGERRGRMAHLVSLAPLKTIGLESVRVHHEGRRPVVALFGLAVVEDRVVIAKDGGRGSHRPAGAGHTRRGGAERGLLRRGRRGAARRLR
eukprot:scaffold6413_cov121-Isochrysis_galbana.AAC.5